MSRSALSLPPDVHIYIFIAGHTAGRTSGVSGHVYTYDQMIRVVAEFTFWPLGTVLSYSDLADNRLAPVHQWASIPFAASEVRDLTLQKLSVASQFPLDFRTPTELVAEQAEPEATFSDDLLRELSRQVMMRGGDDPKRYVYTAHPSQSRLRQRLIGQR